MLLNNYARVDLSFVKGKSSTLKDKNGEKFIDFTSGIGVCSLGHAHKGLAKIISKQSKTILHSSNIFHIEPQELLAGRISELLGGGYRLFFGNSGAEANECAIKLARKWGVKYGKNEIVSLENSFHGRTIATLKMTGQDKFHPEHFAPYPDGFKFYANIDEIITRASNKTAAVIIELVQGEGGIKPLDKDAVLRLANFCKEKNILLITDEVQCGCYRTGEFVTSKIYGIQPDIITFAKGLAGGVPIGACASKHDIFEPGDHGSTFGGNFLSTTAALYVLAELEKLKLSGELDATIQAFSAALDAIAKKYPKIIKKRVGLGLMQGLELKDARMLKVLFDGALEQKLLILKSGKATLRFLPALNIKAKEIIRGFERLDLTLANAKEPKTPIIRN